MAREYVVSAVSAEALTAPPSKAQVTNVVAEVLLSASAYINRPIPKRRKALQHVN